MKSWIVGSVSAFIIGGGLLAANALKLKSTPDVSATPQPVFALKPSPVKRCMNMGGALEAPNEGEWGYSVRREDFARLKAAGFDTVRLPVKFSAHADQSPPFSIDPAFLRRIDEIVDWAILENLQIIIDVHHYTELMQAPGRHERRLEMIWEQLSRHYQNAPPQLMFELINEPNDKMTVSRTDELNRRLLTRVRRFNPDRWVVVGSAGWGAMDALMKSRPPRDPFVMTTFHYYGPFEFTHQGATWTTPVPPTGISWGSEAEYKSIADDMSKAGQWRDATGMPILLGEFGAINKADLASRARWTEAVRKNAEVNGIGWCHWDWATAFPVFDQERDQWIPAMKQALTGP